MLRVVLGGFIGLAFAEAAFIFLLPKHMQDGEMLVVLLLAGGCAGTLVGDVFPAIKKILFPFTKA